MNKEEKLKVEKGIVALRLSKNLKFKIFRLKRELVKRFFKNEKVTG